MVERTIGKYRLVEQIGRGGMGTVYKAVDETLDRTVAIKMINAELLTPENLHRFRSEAMTLARLKHPRIATIHELTREGPDLLMVMEYVAGETCERMIRHTGRLTIPTAAALCSNVLDALEHAHAAGVIHRDLKPSNLMVTPDGDVKIMDFGIARIVGTEHLTMQGFMVGTPAYMAPEQVRGEEVDRRTDLYATAVMLYRLLTHHLPFKADTAVGLIHSQLSDSPTPPRQFRADLPDWLDAILTRGLAKLPADRFQTAREFRLALEQGLARSGADIGRAVSPADETLGPMPTPTDPGPPPSAAVAIPTDVRDSASAPVVTPHPPTEPAMRPDTVTLRKPHLISAAAVLVLLVAVIGVLAYVALRKPLAPAPASSTETAAAPTPTTAPPPSVVPEPAVPERPAAETSPPAAVPPPIPPAPRRGATPDAAATRGEGRAGAAPNSSRGGTPDAAGRSSAPPVAPPEAPVEPPPAPESKSVPDTPPEVSHSFGSVKALVPQGTKAEEQDALLGFESGNVIVRNRDTGAILKTMSYSTIDAATYAHARRPKWKEATAGVAAVPDNIGGSRFFLGTSKHWLTLQSKTDYLVLRLDDKNFRLVMSTIEARTGRKVEGS